MAEQGFLCGILAVRNRKATLSEYPFATLFSGQVQHWPWETTFYMISSPRAKMASSAIQPLAASVASPAFAVWAMTRRNRLPPGSNQMRGGPCGCSLIERCFNRAAQGRLIHQPASIQRAPGDHWQWWRARWLTQWRYVPVRVSLCTQMHEHVRWSSTREQSMLALSLNPDLNRNYIRQRRCLRFDMWTNVALQEHRSYSKVHGL